MNPASERIGRRLMFLAAVFIVLQGLVLTVSPAVRERGWGAPLRFSHWVGIATWLIAMLLLQSLQERRRPFRDPFLLPICALLAGWGLLTIWRLDPSFGLRQTVWLAMSAAVVAWLGGRWGDLGVLRRFRSVLLAAGLVLTALTIVLGTSPTGIGPRLWLGCCGVYLQPSEPLKLLMVIYLAAYLADQVDLNGRMFPMLLPTLVIAALALVLLLVQRDLGSASILILLYTIILYVATGRRRVLIATFIILPLLPDRPLDPWQALNPQSLWLLVLLISGLSLVGYVLTRLLGANRGISITGLTGGLVSSTAVTLSFARQSREPQYANATRAVASGILLAWTVSFLRVLVEVLVVNRSLLAPLLPSIAAMAAVSAGFAGFLLRGAGTAQAAQEVQLHNPFSLTSAMKFAALFAAVLLVVKIVQAYAPESGLYFVAVLAGTTDVDAITLSMAGYARTGNPQLAAQAITLAVLSNTVIKTGMAVALGSSALRRSILLATGAILAAGIAAIVLV